jgi:hypothetical protein
MTREEHKALIDNIKAQAGDVPGAVISDDLAILMSDYSGTLTQTSTNNEHRRKQNYRSKRCYV